MLPALFVSLGLAATPNTVADICLAMVPPHLAEQLKTQHPEFELPTLTDAPIERLMTTAAEGGWPCPFVAIADVDGDGRLDRAVILKHKTAATVRFIVARNDNTWRLEVHKDWPIPIAAAVVEPLEAGFYEQTRGSPEAARQIDQLKSIQSDHAGFLAGNDTGPKQAFFFVNEQWEEIRLEESRSDG